MNETPSDTITVKSVPVVRVRFVCGQHHFDRVRAVVERYDQLEAQWVARETARLVRQGEDGRRADRAARASAIGMRRKWWPGVDGVVEVLLRRRLEDADLVGLQEPLLDEEEERALRLAGRRPGSPDRGFAAQLAVTMAEPVVARARRAAWRLSGGSDGELRRLLELRRGLDGGMSYREYRRRRAVVLKGITGGVTWADLAREAIDRHEA